MASSSVSAAVTPAQAEAPSTPSSSTPSTTTEPAPTLPPTAQDTDSATSASTSTSISTQPTTTQPSPAPPTTTQPSPPPPTTSVPSTLSTPSSQPKPPTEPKLLDALPVTEVSVTAPSGTATPTAPGPSAALSTPTTAVATAEGLKAPVDEGEKVNVHAAASLVSADDLSRWASVAGISLPSKPPPSSETASTSRPSGATPSSSSASASTPIPLIPPPPPPAPSSLSAKPIASRFSFLRRGSTPVQDDPDSEEDNSAAGAGYARLAAPGSDDEDDDDEDDKPNSAIEFGKSGKKAAAESETKPKEDTPEEEDVEVEKTQQEEKSGPGGSLSEEELRNVLREVLLKMNNLSQSHSELLSSHSTLLTTLKIARSNLAMAEANSEMLEEQLKRVKSTPVQPAMAAPQARPAQRTPVTPAVGPGGAISRSATPNSAKASTEINRPYTPRQDKPRPSSLQLPGQTVGGSTSAPSSAAADQNKGVFGGFFNGGKKKLPGGLGTVTIPSAAQVMAALPSPQIGTPGERPFFDWGVSAEPESHKSPPAGRPASLRTEGASAPGLARSMSHNVLPSSGGAAGAAGGSTAPKVKDDGAVTMRAPGTIPTPQNSELFKLRQAYAGAQAKIKSMGAELEALKKGKKEIETELENLSQALFEEANKMVADERKKVAELEENLREAKEERDALRETIKVLGGKVEPPAPSISVEEAKAEEGEEDVEEDEAFVPRDLDKHYEALRKSIHHVADEPLFVPSSSLGGDVSQPGSTVSAPLVLADTGVGAAADDDVDPLTVLPSTSGESAGAAGISTSDKHHVAFALDPQIKVVPAEPNPWASETPSPAALEEVPSESALRLTTASAAGEGEPVA